MKAIEALTTRESRSYPGKIRLGFALFFGSVACLLVLCVLVSLPFLILYPTGTGGPAPSGIFVPIGLCAATLVAAPGAVICVLQSPWLIGFHPGAWRAARVMCYSVVLPGLLLIGAFSLYASFQ